MKANVDKTENKNGNKATYYDKDGNVVVTKSTTSRTIGDKTGLKLYMICR